MVHKQKIIDLNKKYIDYNISKLRRDKKNLTEALIWQGAGLGISKETEFAKNVENKWIRELKNVNKRLGMFEKIKKNGYIQKVNR
jgi:hypothetical protein